MRRHKPAPEAYHSVAAVLQVDPGDIGGDLDAIADQLMERYPAPATVAGSKTR